MKRNLVKLAVEKIATSFSFNLQSIVNSRLGILQWSTADASGEKFFIEEILASFASNESAPVILNVGANEGAYTASILNVLPNAIVYCFEAHPLTCSRLVARFNEDSRVTVDCRAVSDTVGVRELFDHATTEGSGHASVYRQVIDELHHSHPVSKAIEATTLDCYVQENNIKSVLLLKLDIEGHEFSALQGAHQLIKEERVDLIQFEFNEMNVVSRVFLRDFYEFLPGFEFFRLRRDGLIPLGPYSPRNEIFQFQNILAVSSSKAARLKQFFIRRIW